MPVLKFNIFLEISLEIINAFFQILNFKIGIQKFVLDFFSRCFKWLKNCIFFQNYSSLADRDTYTATGVSARLTLNRDTYRSFLRYFKIEKPN